MSRCDKCGENSMSERTFWFSQIFMLNLLNEIWTRGYNPAASFVFLSHWIIIWATFQVCMYSIHHSSLKTSEKKKKNLHKLCEVNRLMTLQDIVYPLMSHTWTRVKIFFFLSKKYFIYYYAFTEMIKVSIESLQWNFQRLQQKEWSSRDSGGRDCALINLLLAFEANGDYFIFFCLLYTFKGIEIRLTLKEKKNFLC